MSHMLVCYHLQDLLKCKNPTKLRQLREFEYSWPLRSRSLELVWIFEVHWKLDKAHVCFCPFSQEMQLVIKYTILEYIPQLHVVSVETSTGVIIIVWSLCSIIEEFTENIQLSVSYVWCCCDHVEMLTFNFCHGKKYTT